MAGGGKDGGPLSNLAWLASRGSTQPFVLAEMIEYILPGSNHVECTTVGTRLDKAHKEPDDAKLGVCLACRAAHSQAGPHYHHAGKPDARRNLLNGDTVGNLTYGITIVCH